MSALLRCGGIGSSRARMLQRHVLLHRACLATAASGPDPRSQPRSFENERKEQLRKNSGKLIKLRRPLPDRASHSQHRDAEHYADMLQELIAQNTPWSQHDMRRVERCLLHFSHHPNPSQTASIKRLWDRAKKDNPTGEMFSHAIFALSKHGHVNEAREALCEFLEKSASSPGHQPHVNHLNAVLRGYARSRQPQHAEALLHNAFSSHQWMTPNVFSVSHVVVAWSKLGNGERAQAVLEWAESNTSLALNLFCYNAALTAWARSENGGPQAEALLRRMPVAPDHISWSAVLHAWATTTQPHGGLERAEHLLWEALSNAQPIDQSCFNSILHALGREGQADRAEKLLKRWMEMEGTTLMPDRFSFNIVLNAIAKSGRDNVGRHAQALCEKMLRAGVTPDPITLNCVLTALAKDAVSTKAQGGEDRRNAGRLAKTLFDEFIQMGVIPNIVTYNALLNVFAKTGDAHEAQKILEGLENGEWKGQRRRADDMSQRRIAYNTVLDAWVNYGRMQSNNDAQLEASEQTQKILRRMLQNKVRPDGRTFASVLNALENCGGRGQVEEAECILLDMEKHSVKPKKVHYSTVVAMWIRNSEPQRAFDVLKHLEVVLKRIDNTGLQVHHVEYVSIIAAFSEQNEPESAEAVLLHMEESGTAPQPPLSAYSVTLSAWAKSDNPNKALRAWHVLERLCSRVDDKRRYRAIPILRDAHNTVMTACSSIPPSAPETAAKEAVEIAFRAFEGTPQRDEDTYKNMRQVIDNLVSNVDEADRLIKRLKRR